MSDPGRKAYKLLDVPPAGVANTSTSTAASAAPGTGGTRLVNAAKTANAGAFHCATCDATFTSYDAYLDHVNSRLHQRNAGTQAVERVDDPARIRARLAQLREQRAEGERQRRRLTEDPVAAIQERIEQRQRQEELDRQRRRELGQQQKTKSTQAEEPPSEEAALMASVLGITSFK